MSSANGRIRLLSSLGKPVMLSSLPEAFIMLKDVLIKFCTASNSTSILPFVPRSIRLLAFLVLLLNVRSLPLAWHFRVFRPVFYIRAKLLSLMTTKARIQWLDSLQPIGKSPWELRSTYSTWASPDESDYNFHLSNSSYSKILDITRFRFALQHMCTVFRDGCWMALGGSHLKFVREIPIGKKYEVRCYLGGWDEKWVYVVSRFVSKKSPSDNKESARGRIEGAKKALVESTQPESESSSNAAPKIDLHTPASVDVSGANTPITSSAQPGDGLSSIWEEGPDEILHCVAMNEMCIKIGRITVPPALVFATAGCASPDKVRWDDITRMRSGSGKEMRELLKGGWRNVPEGQRWWDDALAEFEGERVRRLTVLRAMREGVEGLQSI